jgi:hypothetical protein
VVRVIETEPRIAPTVHAQHTLQNVGMRTRSPFTLLAAPIGGLISLSQRHVLVRCFSAQPFTGNRLLPLLPVAAEGRAQMGLMDPPVASWT